MIGPIYTPPPEVVARSQLTAFGVYCERATGRRFPDYDALHAFSVEEFGLFWQLFLRWAEPAVEGSAEPACLGDDVETAQFFPQLRLSYAESLLRGADRAPAVTSLSEDGRVVRWDRGELRARVGRLAASLVRLGVKPGDRVAAVARNQAETVLACLATAAVGAIWSSTATDLAPEAVLSRFAPLEPTVLFAVGGTHYHGLHRPLGEKLAAIAAGLPSLTACVALDDAPLPELSLPVHPLATLLERGASFPWPRFPFNQPLFILFSSGTTGPPKCIVHGAGGTLLEHLKEHRLHGDLRPEDKLFFHTTAGWMMWNWQLSALACGAEIVLYDGSVSFPEDDALWRLVSRERVTVFGTSPTYLQYCRDAGIIPRDRVDLAALRMVQSTGSILFDTQYDWVQENVKELPVQSISGGTDILGCFVLGDPNHPVWRGESQCLGLGLDVRSLGGELVCARPFPSRPLGLYGDADGSRFHQAYFSQNPGFWTHGDFIEITPRGTARILGRSDGVLNIRGIRIGPAEIYHVLHDVPEVAAGLAVSQTAPREPGGTRLVLFVQLHPGAELDRPLTLRIKKLLSQRCSPSHVPAVIIQLDDLPTTQSGKRSERAAQDVLDGRPVRNLEALRNPECLEALRDHPALRLS